MAILLTIAAKAALTAFLAWAYVCFYRKSRGYIMPGGSKSLLYKMPVCFLYNFLLFLLLKNKNPDYLSQKQVFLFLAVQIADIDWLCTKIPTELLIGFMAVCFQHIFTAPLPVSFAVFLLFFLAAGIWLYGKAGIGLYDVFFFALTGAALRSIDSFLLMISKMLILWGITGLFLRVFPSNRSVEKIPLSPLIVFAFCFSL